MVAVRHTTNGGFLMSRIAPSRSAFLVGVVVAMLLVCAPVGRQSEAADTASDRALCTRLWQDHLEAVKNLQPEKIAFTKDAVLINPDMRELRGRDAIQAHLVKAFVGLKILEVGFKMERFEVIGTRAYTFVTVDERVQEGAAPPANRHARCATVWEQQPDKSWQISYLLVNYLKM
jgi:ketosteroid isomerase-like protein